MNYSGNINVSAPKEPYFVPYREDFLASMAAGCASYCQEELESIRGKRLLHPQAPEGRSTFPVEHLVLEPHFRFDRRIDDRLHDDAGNEGQFPIGFSCALRRRYLSVVKRRTFQLVLSHACGRVHMSYGSRNRLVETHHHGRNFGF